MKKTKINEARELFARNLQKAMDQALMQTALQLIGEDVAGNVVASRLRAGKVANGNARALPKRSKAWRAALSRKRRLAAKRRWSKKKKAA